MHRIPINLLFIFIATSFVPAQAQDSVKFRLKMSKNDQLIYKTTASLNQVQNLEVNGQKVKIETVFATTSVDVRSLKKSDEKTLQIRTENKKLKVKANVTQLGEYSYDSESDENDTSSMLGAGLTPIFDLMNGAELSFTVSSRGEVIEYKSYENLIRDALKDNDLAKQFFAGGNAAKFDLSFFTPFFSEKAVKKGDKWENPFDLKIKNVGDLKGKRIFTFAGMEEFKGRKSAKITMTIEMTIDLDTDQAGSQVKGSLEITESSGSFHIDPDTGQLLSAELKFVSEGDLTVTAGGMEIPLSMTQAQAIKVILLDKLPE